MTLRQIGRQLGWRGGLAAALALALLTAVLWAQPAEAQSSPPDAPASVTVTRTGSTLTATWDAPAGATKYHVTYSSDGKKSWSAAAGPDDNHSAATIDIAGINTTKAYVVGVRAGNEHGWSSWRNSAPNVPSGKPAKVGYVSINRVDGAITASWNSVVGADKYHITYSSDNRQSWSLAAGSHASTSITISVDNQHTYYVGVRAGKTSGNDTLWSGWRNSPSSAPWVPADPPPSAPASVTLSRSCNAMSVSWAPVSGATGYDVNVSTNKRKSWKRALSNVTYTSWNFAKWNKNKTYTLAVRARNAAGVSGWTNSSTVQPPPVCAVSGLRAVTGTTHGTAGGSITTTWNAGQGASAYNVNYRVDGGDWTRIASNVSGTTHTGTVSTTSGYTVAVQSVNGGNTSPWRNAGVAWLTASGITSSGATLTLAGHSGDWYVKKTSPTPAGDCSSAISGTTHNLSNLLGSTTFTHTAYSDSSCATAIGSATFTTTASTAAPSAPAAPALTTGNAQLTTEWTAPAHNGSAITDYDLRYRTQGTTGWNTAFIQGATYSPGLVGNGKTSNGSTGQALDLGNVSLSGLTVTKVTTGGVSNVYKISEAVGGFRLKLHARNAKNNTTLTYRARYASTAPTTGNMNTHGTLMWEHTGGYGFNFTKDAWTLALPANTHFWISTTADGVSDAVTPTIQADAVRVPSTLRTNITGLTNGTTYDVQARAVNANGLGAWSPSGTLKAGLPARASAPTIAYSGNGLLAVTWATVSGNGSTVTDYDLRYSSDGGSTWTDVEMDSTANTARSYTITNLTNNTAYIVQLRATNTHGDGLWSPSSTSVKAGAPDAPTAPTLASGNATLTATWTAPSDNGSAITGYGVQYSTDGSTWSSANVAVTLSTRTAVITGLTNDTAYQVRVRATNARATGTWSPSATDKPGRPPAPSAPTLTAGARQLTATWTGTTNGLAITDYDVQYRKSSVTDWSDWAHTGTAVTATITGLEGVVTYEVRVRAESSAGEGPWSAAASLATTASIPDTPAAPTLDLGVANQITARWIAPYDGGSALTGFKVRYKESSASGWTTHTFSSTGSTTQTTISSLTSDTKYDVQVLATNGMGDSLWSDTTQGTEGGLSQPTATLSPGNGRLLVAWTAPSNPGTGITDYDVRYRQVGASSWTRVSDGGTVGQAHQFNTDSASSTDPIDFGNLGAGITREALGSHQGLYKVPNAIDEMHIYMQANNGAAFTLRTSASKPTDLSVGTVLASSTTTTPNNQFIEWVGPIAANGYFWAAPTSGSSSYSSRYRRIYHIDLATTATTYTLTGLTNGTEYEVQVRAENSGGESEWSSPVKGTPTVPALTASNIQAKEATLNLTVHTAQWWYKADTGPHTSCQGPVAANTSTRRVTHLTGGTTYVYTAYSDSGCSDVVVAGDAFTTDLSLDVYDVDAGPASH